MIRRPLNSRFADAVREGRKITTIRPSAWPVGAPIMLYSWSGRPYRSPQIDMAAVRVWGARPIILTRDCDDIVATGWPLEWRGRQLWSTEGFNSRAEFCDWFRPLIPASGRLEQHIMLFGLA